MPVATFAAKNGSHTTAENQASCRLALDIPLIFVSPAERPCANARVEVLTCVELNDDNNAGMVVADGAGSPLPTTRRIGREQLFIDCHCSHAVKS